MGVSFDRLVEVVVVGQGEMHDGAMVGCLPVGDVERCLLTSSMRHPEPPDWST